MFVLVCMSVFVCNVVMLFVVLGGCLWWCVLLYFLMCMTCEGVCVCVVGCLPTLVCFFVCVW